MARRDLVVRQHRYVGRDRLGALANEESRARSGQKNHRSVRRAAAFLDAILNFPHALRREVQVTGAFSVLDGGFDGLLGGGIEQEGRHIAGWIEQRLHDLAANRLSDVFRQEYGVLSNWGSFAQRL